MWYIHTIKYYLALKKRENPATWDDMDEPGGHYAEWNKPSINKTNTA